MREKSLLTSLGLGSTPGCLFGVSSAEGQLHSREPGNGWQPLCRLAYCCEVSTTGGLFPNQVPSTWTGTEGMARQPQEATATLVNYLLKTSSQSTVAAACLLPTRCKGSCRGVACTTAERS